MYRYIKYIYNIFIMSSNIYEIEDFIKAINYINTTINIIDKLILEQRKLLIISKKRTYQIIFSKNGKASTKIPGTSDLKNQIDNLIQKYFNSVNIEIFYNNLILNFTGHKTIPKQSSGNYLITTYILNKLHEDIKYINQYKEFNSKINTELRVLEFAGPDNIQKCYYQSPDNSECIVDLNIESKNPFENINITPYFNHHSNPEISQILLSDNIFISLMSLIYETKKTFSLEEFDPAENLNLDLYKKVNQLYEEVLLHYDKYKDTIDDKFQDAWVGNILQTDIQKQFFCLGMIMVDKNNKSYVTTEGIRRDKDIEKLESYDITESVIKKFIRELLLLPNNYNT